MDTGDILTLVGVIVAILLHAFATIWWASRVSTTLENILLSLSRIDAEFGKRDEQIETLRKKVDVHSEMLAKHGAMIESR